MVGRRGGSGGLAATGRLGPSEVEGAVGCNAGTQARKTWSVAPQTPGLLLLTAAAEPVGDLTLIGPIELFGRPPTGTSE